MKGVRIWRSHANILFADLADMIEQGDTVIRLWGCDTDEEYVKFRACSYNMENLFNC
jgi:hypothetical protein